MTVSSKSSPHPAGAVETETPDNAGRTTRAALANHFERLYRSDPDPWRLATSWYEQRKIALVLAMLPAPRFGSILELACGAGFLSEALALRGDRLTASDLSASAVAAARARLAGQPHVEIRHRDSLDVLDDPAERDSRDLIVVSEFAYYLGDEALQRLVAGSHRALAAGGHVLACHGRRAFDDRVQKSERVHEAFGRLAGLENLCRYEDKDVLIDVWHKRPGLRDRRSAG